MSRKSNGTVASRPKGPILPWSDDVVLEREGVHRLALVARAFCLMDALDAITLDHEGRTSDYLTNGIGQALAQMARAEDWGGIGSLLEGLEALVWPEGRAEWPLAEIAEDAS